MRGLLITLIVFGGLPFIFMEPIIGLLMWAWLSYMTPYRLAWGFAHSFPFVMLSAVVTLMSLVVAKREKWFPWTPTTSVWVAFLVWMTLSMILAIYPHNAFVKWEEVMKIQLMVLVTFLLIHERKHLDWVVWVAVISIGFYGVKGGIFTILTGGHYHVWGPAHSWIGDNNELGAAVLLVMPLMRYLQLHAQRRWMWWGFGAAMILSGFTVLGTYSRGDFLGAIVMVALLWWRSRRKLMLAVPLFVAALTTVAFMPAKWVERMHSISGYKHNASALGRINAWHFATNLAVHHPFFGGGFEAFTAEMFRKYAPEPNNFHAAHSIFFQILGDNGFVGLGLYLVLGLLTLRSCSWVLRNTQGHEDLVWARDLAAMLQVGFAGFGASAAFLSLAYYDLPYQLMACVVILELIVKKELQERVAASDTAGTASGEPVRRWQVGLPAIPNGDERHPAWRPGVGHFREQESKMGQATYAASPSRSENSPRLEAERAKAWRPGHSARDSWQPEE